MKKLVLLVGAAVLLAGCQTTSPEVRLANNNAACSGYGFKAGTDAYAACMMQKDRDDEAEARQRQRAIGAALSDMGKSMQQQNRSVTCNTYGTANRFGNSAYGNSTTTCY